MLCNIIRFGYFSVQFFPDDQSIEESKLLKSFNAIELELTFVFKSSSIYFYIVYSNLMHMFNAYMFNNVMFPHLCLRYPLISSSEISKKF